MSTIFFEYHHEIVTGPRHGERTLRFEAYATPVIPAKIWGPPEDCHPEEGGDFEVYDVECETHEILDMDQDTMIKLSSVYGKPGEYRALHVDIVVVKWADGEVCAVELDELMECAWDQAPDPDDYY